MPTWYAENTSRRRPNRTIDSAHQRFRPAAHCGLQLRSAEAVFSAARGQSALDRCEAALEFEVGLPQNAFRVGVEMPGQVDHCEQEVANLGRCAVRVGAVEFGLDLVGFFSNFGEHGARVVPVEADLAGLVLQLQSTRQRGQGDRYT